MTTMTITIMKNTTLITLIIIVVITITIMIIIAMLKYDSLYDAAHFSAKNPALLGFESNVGHSAWPVKLSAMPSAPQLASPSLAALVVADASTKYTAWRKTYSKNVDVNAESNVAVDGRDAIFEPVIPLCWLVIRDSMGFPYL